MLFFFLPNSFTRIHFETLKNTNSKHLQPRRCRRASLPPRTPSFVFAVLHRPASRCHSSSTNTIVCFRRPPPPVAAILPPRTPPSVFVLLHRQHQSATVALHHRQFSSSSSANTNLRPSPSTTVSFRRPPPPTPICDRRPPPPSSSMFYLFLLNLPPSATAIFTHENIFFHYFFLQF